MSLSMILTPYCLTPMHFIIINILHGVAAAAIDVLANSWTPELGQDKFNFFLQVCYFFVSIGQTVGPLIAGPFLPNHHPNEYTLNLSCPSCNKSLSNQLTVINLPSSQIYIPYSISSIILSLSALFMLFVILIHPYTHSNYTFEGRSVVTSYQNLPQSDDELLNYDENIHISENLPRTYYTIIVVLGVFMITLEAFAENNFLSFMATFAVKSQWHFPEAKGAWLVSSTGLAYILVRFTCIFIALSFSPLSMLYSSVLIVILVNTSVAFYSGSVPIYLWLFSFVGGLGYAIAYPTIIALIESKMNINSFLSSQLILWPGLVNCANYVLTLNLIEKWPKVYIYIGLAPFCFLLLGTITFQLIDRWRDKYNVI